MKQWLTDKCIPLVREVTFENVEELTEEGLPFLIFFRDPANKEDDKFFTDLVLRELHDQKAAVNALLADGHKFAHPLKHLGKNAKDLPVLAIDSFQHMFLFPDMKELPQPGKLRQVFLLYSLFVYYDGYMQVFLVCFGPSLRKITQRIP